MDELKQARLLKDAARAVQRQKERDFQSALSKHLAAIRKQASARETKLPEEDKDN